MRTADVIGNLQFQSILKLILYILKETNDEEKTTKVLLNLIKEAV
jgi:hypothetical protein